MVRPVISFITDFGPDSAVAICHGVMLSIANDAHILDITHAVRKYAIRDGAYLLWSAVPWLPVGVHVAVVDPGVGTERLPIGILAGRGDVLIGPDNGVLIPAAERLGGIAEVRALENRDLMLQATSSTFHGRDIFAPVAAHVAAGSSFESVGPAFDPAELVQLHFPDPIARDGGLDTSVLYVDSFGNLRLSGFPNDLRAAVGELRPGRLFDVEFGAVGDLPAVRERIPWARTFGEIAHGAALLYEDSFGRLACADNQGDIARRLAVGVERPVRIRPV